MSQHKRETLLTTIFLAITLFSAKLMGQQPSNNPGVSLDSLDHFVGQKMHQL